MPEKVERESVSFSLPKTMVATLRAEADTRIVSPSLLAEKAIAAYLPTLPAVNVETDVPTARG